MPTQAVRIPYEEILRGKFYMGAIAFTDGQPLKFIEDCSACSFCSLSSGTCGKIIEKSDGFEPVHDPVTKRYYNPEVQVLIKHKVRHCVVIQKDFYNHDTEYHQVYVIPVVSIKPYELKLPEIQQLINDNDIAGLHYIGTITGTHAYLNLTDIKRIHKSLLLRKLEINGLDEPTLTEICKKIAGLMDIKQISECETCDKRCENCQLKKNVEAVNQ